MIRDTVPFLIAEVITAPLTISTAPCIINV